MMLKFLHKFLSLLGVVVIAFSFIGRWWNTTSNYNWYYYADAFQQQQQQQQAAAVTITNKAINRFPTKNVHKFLYNRQYHDDKTITASRDRLKYRPSLLPLFASSRNKNNIDGYNHYDGPSEMVAGNIDDRDNVEIIIPDELTTKREISRTQETAKTITTKTATTTTTTTTTTTVSTGNSCRRHFLIGSTAFITASTFTSSNNDYFLFLTDPSLYTANDVANAVDVVTLLDNDVNNNNNYNYGLPWETSPINKRSGIKVYDAEKDGGYNVAFVTYLSRILLNYDTNCQKWWFTTKLPSNLRTISDIEEFRIKQFAKFSASVEIGLLQFKGPDGAKLLLQDLVQRYGTPPPSQQTVDTRTTTTTTTSSDNDRIKSQKRVARSARRHIALLFGLLDSPLQPTQEMTKLLASVDNGSITSVQLLSNITTSFTTDADTISTWTVIFPQSPVGEQTVGRIIWRPTGRISRLDVIDPGSGYKTVPTITISPPINGDGIPAQVKVKQLTKKGGGIDNKIIIIDPGFGYTDIDEIKIEISNIDSSDDGVVPPTIVPILEQTIDRIEVTKPGSGYAVEKPKKIYIQQKQQDTINIDLSGGDNKSSSSSREKGSSNRKEQVQQPILIGQASAVAEKTSFTSFRKDIDRQQLNELEEDFEKRYNLPSATEGDSPNIPFLFGPKSKSAELLRLLPSGIGLEYDGNNKRYILAADTEFMKQYPTSAEVVSNNNRRIFPEFGPRARAPIERDRQLDINTYIRFALSGAVCSSAVHLLLTPIDVVKTKVQTNPIKYPTIKSTFGKVYKEEGTTTFFTGYIPTFVGNFIGGGVLYAVTEIIRRSLTDLAGIEATNLEVPIILIAAAISSAMGAILICPFEAVRIRTVSEPDYANTSVSVLQRMIQEEGISTLFNAIPIFLIRNVPYAMTKFTVFDLSTERMYEAFPTAQEDLGLSLLVSLIGGILGGTAAAFISNPADAVISELKKSKSDMSPITAVNNLLERAGISTFFVGLPLRILYYSLVASLSFVVYDAVRFSLGIGSDDLKLYLDVLGGALGTATTTMTSTAA